MSCLFNDRYIRVILKASWVKW